jgi:adenylate kinase
MGESLVMVRCDPWKRIIRKGYIGHWGEWAFSCRIPMRRELVTEEDQLRTTSSIVKAAYKIQANAAHQILQLEHLIDRRAIPW